MEELRSTEIIDKEIISDAEKKAERIVLKAEEESKRIASSVESRVQNEVLVSENNFKTKLANFSRDLNASVALENSRFFVSFIQESLVKNINEYLSSVSDDEFIEMLCKKIQLLNLSEHKINAYVYGLDEKKSEKALQKVLGNSLVSVKLSSFNQILYEESLLDDANNKGFILLSENEEIKCRFTLCSVIEEILDKNRMELAESLFGKDGLEE